MIDHNQLANFMRQELALHSRHCKLLEEQQQALLACNRSQFCSLQPSYAALMERFEAQTAQRKEFLKNQDGEVATLYSLIESVSEQNQSVLHLLYQRLKYLIEMTQMLCRRNIELIQRELNYFTFSLDTLVEAGRQADMSYGGSRQSRRMFVDRCA